VPGDGRRRFLGVDYGLLDAGGRLIEDPVCYRDHRTDGAMERVLRTVPRAEIFQRTGIQFLQFNTLFQLAVHVREGLPAGARRLLMVPDLCTRRSADRRAESTRTPPRRSPRREDAEMGRGPVLAPCLRGDHARSGFSGGDLGELGRAPEGAGRGPCGSSRRHTTPRARSPGRRSSRAGPTSPRAPGRSSASSSLASRERRRGARQLHERGRAGAPSASSGT